MVMAWVSMVVVVMSWSRNNLGLWRCTRVRVEAKHGERPRIGFLVMVMMVVMRVHVVMMMMRRVVGFCAFVTLQIGGMSSVALQLLPILPRPTSVPFTSSRSSFGGASTSINFGYSSPKQIVAFHMP